MDYKKYSLENLENWLHDAISCSEATPQEIYDVIKNVVSEEYYIYKNHTERCYELLALLNGNGKDHLTCDKDDKSPECQNAWNDFWEENYYPEEHQKYNQKINEYCMPSWGHSDLEYLANSILTKDRISNFPGEQYTEEELNAMCDKAASDQEKDKCREYNLREAEYYNKRAQLDAEQNDIFNNVFDSRRDDKVVKWQLPVEIHPSGEYFVQFPDDLLEAADLKEGDSVEWVAKKDGSYLLRKVVLDYTEL